MSYKGGNMKTRISAKELYRKGDKFNKKEIKASISWKSQGIPEIKH